MNRSKNWINLFIALLLYIPLGFLQNSIDCRRKVEDLESRMLLMPGQMAGSLILGGFKGIAADLLWLNVEEYWHDGAHYKMLPLLESIAWLQPTFITVWAVGGWHMAYNIYAACDGDPKQQKYWYDQGVQYLKKGISNNRDRYDLYFELGWTYYHKGKDYPNAVRYLSRAVVFPHPDYVDNVLAHAYEKSGDIKTALACWENILKSRSTFKSIAERMIHDLKTKGKATP